MRFFITGATGFVGARLARRLVADGHDVVALARAASNKGALADVPITWAEGDVTDLESLCRGLKGCDAAFHVAGYVSFEARHAGVMYRVNVEGSRNVREACLREGVKRVVATSSVAAVGYTLDGSPADENVPIGLDQFAIAYNRTKYLGEREMLAGVAQGLEVVVVNPTSIFGPGDIHFNGGETVRQAKLNGVPVYPPGGMSVVDVDDVVEAHVQAMQRGVSGRRYIVAGENLTHREIFTTVAQVVGVKPPSIALPGALLWFVGAVAEAWGAFTKKKAPVTRALAYLGTLRLYHDNRRMRDELGIEPMPFRRSIERTYRWYVDNGLLSP